MPLLVRWRAKSGTKQDAGDQRERVPYYSNGVMLQTATGSPRERLAGTAKWMRYTQPVGKFREKWGLGIWLVLTAVACIACGGRSESEPDSSESTGSHAPNGNDDDATTGGTTDTNGDLPLGDCVEGWPIYEGECPWEGSDHLCYATKEAACACLCPRDRRSTCLSGLPGGPDSHTAVSCF